MAGMALPARAATVAGWYGPARQNSLEMLSLTFGGRQKADNTAKRDIASNQLLPSVPHNCRASLLAAHRRSLPDVLSREGVSEAGDK